MRALLLVLLATTAHADVSNEAMIGSHIRALHSDSANALTDDSLGGPTFGYARRLPIDVGIDLWGTANMLVGFVEGEMFQTMTTRVGMLQPSFGVRATYPLWRQFVVASARIDVGVQRARVDIEDSAGHEAHDTGWGAVSTAAVGLELAPLALHRVHVGLRAELGYVATTGVDMNARSAGAGEDTIELDRMAASLGALDIGGRYFSFVLTTRF